MKNLRCALAALALALAATGCPSVDVDTDETTGPIVQFDPGNSVIPFPNNLVRDRTTGKVALPAQACESPASLATRTMVLNTLDGFGTWKTGMRVNLSVAFDDADLTATGFASFVFMYPRIGPAGAVDPATAPRIPVVALEGTVQRFNTDCTPSVTVPSATIVPRVPLTQNTTYVVAVVAGAVADGGEPYGASSTWGLVRQTDSPVTLDAQGNVISDSTPLDPRDPVERAQLQGLDLLWKAHNPALVFLDGTGKTRDQILIAWEFTTATVTTPLDPTVTGSLAANLPVTALVGMASITGGNTQLFLEAALGGAGNCAQLGCASVDDVLAGTVVAPQYQVGKPNPLAGGESIPGPWGDPYMPTSTSDEAIDVLAFLPVAPTPANGWPTIVFAHGITRSKETLYAIGPQLARAGFASIALDFVAHGTRAVQTSNDPGRGCGTPTPTVQPQCFAPIFSSDLAGTRDNLRQTALDLMRLVNATRACTGTTCNTFEVDPAKVGFLGMSLGGIIGSVAAAEAVGLRGGVTNVAAVSLIDVIEYTDTVGLRCGLVDALIDAGVIIPRPGEPNMDKWNPGAGTGICTTDEWRAQAGYKTFSNIARWVLDPADGANYASKLAQRPTLLQEVVGDLVVPNEATFFLGALTGRTPAPAAMADAFPPPPSMAITTMPTLSKWVQYSNLPPAGGFPGNTYTHSSLLAPAGGTTDGQLATAQLQVDMLTFLGINVGN